MLLRVVSHRRVFMCWAARRRFRWPFKQRRVAARERAAELRRRHVSAPERQRTGASA